MPYLNTALLLQLVPLPKPCIIVTKHPFCMLLMYCLSFRAAAYPGAETAGRTSSGQAAVPHWLAECWGHVYIGEGW
eukprot:1160944-Pelagomonas_calceolata.AAC.3